MNWFFVDKRGRVIAANPNNMTGNSDWVGVDADIPDALTTTDGTPLYKIDGGELVARSAAEIEADQEPASSQQPSLEERVEVVEEATEAIADAINELLEG